MKQILLLSLVCALSACVMAGGHLSELRAQKPSGNDFLHDLAREYLAYAEARSEEGHPLRADYFARKGLESLRGTWPQPEEKPPLEPSRAALVAVLTPDLRDIAPARAARAQLLFDCWAERQPTCQAGFQQALHELQSIADALVQEDDNRFALFFAPGRAHLDAQMLSVVEIVASRVSGLGRYQVELFPVDAENKMTVRRLLAIEKALIKEGVNAGRIHSHRTSRGNAVTLSTDEAGHDRQTVWLAIQTYGQAPEAVSP